MVKQTVHHLQALKEFEENPTEAGAEKLINMLKEYFGDNPKVQNQLNYLEKMFKYFSKWQDSADKEIEEFGGSRA